MQKIILDLASFQLTRPAYCLGGTYRTNPCRAQVTDISISRGTWNLTMNDGAYHPLSLRRLAKQRALLDFSP